MDLASAEGEKVLRKVFHDIAQGYSTTSYQNNPIHIKHFDYEDQIEIDDYYDQVFTKVKEKGLPTTEEAFEYVKSENLWTAGDDKGLLEAQMFLEGVKSRKKSLVIPSQIKAIEGELKEAQKELDEWEKKKHDLLHDTCETYTDKKVNDFGMWVLFYKNRALTERLFTWKEFYDIDKKAVLELFGIFAKATQQINVENIKYIALAPFFSNYYNLLGTMGHTFFGDKPIYKLSFNQVTLLSYAKVFKNIFENIADIPDEVRNRPDALLQFAESNKKAEKFRSRAASKDGYSVVGATQRDMSRMGLGKGENTIDISTLAKQKGRDGRLTAQDFI